MGLICVHAGKVEEIGGVDSDRFNLLARLEGQAFVLHAFEIGPRLVDFAIGQRLIELHHAELFGVALHVDRDDVFAAAERVIFEFLQVRLIIDLLGT